MEKREENSDLGWCCWGIGGACWEDGVEGGWAGEDHLAEVKAMG